MAGNPNDGLKLGTLDKYKGVLSALGVSDLISFEPKPETLEEYIIKAIFYSNSGIGAHNRSASSLLLEGSFIQKEGHFGDAVLLMQIPKVIKKLGEFKNKKMTTDDLRNIREDLIENIFGNSKYQTGFRRYRNSTGPYITCPANDMEPQLSATVDRLNRPHPNPIDAFLEGVQFHSEFIKIHPFEDTDGRIGRLLYNAYAIKNGVRAMHITEDLKEVHLRSLHPYYFTGYMGSAVASMLLLTLSTSKTSKLFDRIDASDDNSLYMLELKSLIKLYGNRRPENKELGSDIKRLFEGRKVDPNFGYAAVWLSSFAKLDNEVISRAYKEGQEDPKLRTLAVHAMGLVDFSKYRKNIETALFNDFDDNVRMQAIIQMGMNEDINGEIGNRLIAVEKSKSVLVALGKAFTFKTTKDKTILEAAGKLISDRDTDVKLRGYQAYAAHSEDTDLMNMLSNLGGCPPLIKKEVVVELKRSGKLNSPDVATMLSEMAKTDSSIRLTLLGELSLLDHSGANYKPLLEGIMRSKGHSEGERAHAIYLLGRENGSDYLYSNKGHIDMNSKLEREAFLLAYFDSMGKAIKSSSPLPEHSIVAIMPYGESFETYEKFLISMELGKHLNGNGNPAAKVIGPLPPTGANAGNLSSLAAPLRDRERADETSFLSEVPRLFQEKYGTVVNSAKDLLFASRHPLTQIARGEAAPQINVHAAKTKA